MVNTEQMGVYGRGAISNFLGDHVVYRNLAPVDVRLPGLDQLRNELGLAVRRTPRKVEPDYARVIVRILQAAQTLATGSAKIERLVFVGDTQMNDGTAFSNICQAGGWRGRGFIGSETRDRPSSEINPAGEGRSLFLSNRWSELGDFDLLCQKQNFSIDESTAVIIDLDKTALGARGRNAHVIDQARVQAVKDTVAGLLGPEFDEASFRSAYDRLNQVAYHPFTRDNQDYLAYICLILGSGLFDLTGVVEDVEANRLTSFEGFIERVEDRAGELSPQLREIHAEITANVQAGDPTPFKAFRRNEYRTTIGRMGWMEDDQPVEALLANEIVITQEVREIAEKWRRQGAILFGLSDKPDEASLPTQELAEEGFLAIHRTRTHVVGTFER